MSNHHSTTESILHIDMMIDDAWCQRANEPSIGHLRVLSFVLLNGEVRKSIMLNVVY